jgi:hypothetical protein
MKRKNADRGARSLAASTELVKTNEPKRGRPRKISGDTKFVDFARAGIVMSLYDELRGTDMKHSASVRQVAELIKQGHPEIRISETGVKRILATFRPRTAGAIPLFERSSMTDAGIERIRGMLKQVPPEQQSQGSKMPSVTNLLTFSPRTRYLIRFGERPNYPRHNRKI